jgi:DNA-binding response OmpR family regulator
MTPTPTTKRRRAPIRAAIISSELDPGLLEQMTERLVAAGFRDVRTFADAAEVAPPSRGKSDRQRLAPALRGRMLIVMDEEIGGRSAFDLHAMLKAAPELKGPRFFLLLNDAADANVFAAWNAGIQCVLAKPFVMDEFETFAGRLYEALASEPDGPAAEAPAP